MKIIQAFGQSSPYTKKAKFIAIAWTLLIVVLCFMPAKEIPHVDVPFIDKWTHLVLFGVFALLWLCAYPALKWQRLLLMLIICIVFGSLIEIFQGILSFLGRACEFMDGVADSVGGVLGIGLYCVMARVAGK